VLLPVDVVIDVAAGCTSPLCIPLPTISEVHLILGSEMEFTNGGRQVVGCGFLLQSSRGVLTLSLLTTANAIVL